MRARTAVIAAVLIALFGTPPADARARERTERQEYLLGDLFPDCWVLRDIVSPPMLPVSANRGGACFRVRAFEVSVAVEVEDDSGLPVAGTYQFETRQGDFGTHRTFCGFFAARVPAGGARLIVFIHGPTNGALLYGPSTDAPACLDRGGTGWGTTGTITARFTLDPRYF